MERDPHNNPKLHFLGDGEKIEVDTLIRQGATVMPFGEWVEITARSLACSREDAATHIMEQIQLRNMVIQA